jgi:hypothetical protein
MGRPQKHANHPLYQLRMLLSATGRAITQTELSRILDIPLPTLQSIECGRRGWTREVRLKIRQMIWAVWDETKNRWMFEHSVPPKEFSYSLFEKYRRFIGESAPIPETDTETIKMRIDALFERVQKDSWMKLYWRLQDCLEECRQDFELKELEELFAATQDQVHFSPATFTRPDKAFSHTAEPLQRAYSYTHKKRQLPDYLRDYYKRCAKHYRAISQRAPRTWSDFLRLDEAPPSEG